MKRSSQRVNGARSINFYGEKPHAGGWLRAVARLFFRLDVIEIRVPPLRKLTPLAGGRRQDRRRAQEVREDLRVPHVRQRRARVLRRRPPAVSRARRGGRVEEGLRLVREAPAMRERLEMRE